MARSVVTVEDVGKRFRLHHDKPQSLKERVVRMGRITYEDFWALRDVTFDVADGETVGLLGRNGSGKSTLLKCIAGIFRPTLGRIRTSGRLAALLELGAGFHPDLTGRENVYLNGSILGLPKGEIDRRFDDIVAFAELESFIDNQVKHFSSGMYARLGFAVAVNVDPDVLLIDEVLAVGDEAFQRKCLNRIKQFQAEGRTIVFVTHGADVVRQICDRAVVLEHGLLVADEEPGQAVRTFREGLLRQGLGEAGADPAAQEGGVPTKSIQISSVEVRYPTRSRAHLLPGEPLAIGVRYQAMEDVDDVVFGVAVHDTEGKHVFGTNSEILGTTIDVREGEGEVSIRFASVPLLDGTYFLTLGVHHPGGDLVYDWSEHEHAFQVLNPARTVGLVDLKATITVRGANVSRRTAV